VHWIYVNRQESYSLGRVVVGLGASGPALRRRDGTAQNVGLGTGAGHTIILVGSFWTLLLPYLTPINP
jgi:hypothetical protein